MTLRNKKIIGLIILYMINVVTLHACLTTFINDKGGRVIVYNKNDKTLIPIQKNEKRRFGDHHKHAYFAIYLQQPNKQIFSRVYVCKQNECGNNGNIQLKLSDVENQTGATQLFTITKSTPHSSMVQKLPIMQKKNCHACERE
jgi:hypothetical protein